MKSLFIFISVVLLFGCKKDTDDINGKKLYQLPLKTIKKSLLGKWQVKSSCSITIAGSNCVEPENDFYTFTYNDSLIYTSNGQVVRRNKIEFYKVAAADRVPSYKADSIYAFRLLPSGGTLIPNTLVNDSLSLESAIISVDAGGEIILIRQK